MVGWLVQGRVSIRASKPTRGVVCGATSLVTTHKELPTYSVLGTSTAADASSRRQTIGPRRGRGGPSWLPRTGVVPGVWISLDAASNEAGVGSTTPWHRWLLFVRFVWPTSWRLRSKLHRIRLGILVNIQQLFVLRTWYPASASSVAAPVNC
jgi:hypothetical protein